MEKSSMTWRGIAMEITFTPDRFGLADHIELRTEGKAPLPVTETGYRSHFVAAGSVAEYGGALAYVTDWLDAEAERIGWNGAQMSLLWKLKTVTARYC
ncbi:hypothetical protein ACFMBG_13340 [Leisingera sp. D0M16]|uniref:hypothetical protein n=1 Tax=Leisingera coralii TaxID=3351347 RepID=UPI003B7EA3E6